MIKFFWSRQPGRFVDKTTGEPLTGGTFTGTVREWYETLIEVMIDVTLSVSTELREYPLRYLSWKADPNIYTIVSCSVLHKPEQHREIGTIGSEESGVVANIPISSDARLARTSMLELWQFYGSSAERLVGELHMVD